MPRPHLLLITLDECRFDALSCYGGRVVATPRMDALATTGVRFTAAYAPSPLCLPSRTSLITGLYPHRHGAYSNFRTSVIDPAVPNLYRRLAADGYHTAHVGKCHYAPVPYGRSLADPGMAEWPRARDTALALGIAELHLCELKQPGSAWPDDYSDDVLPTGLHRTYADWQERTFGTTQSFVFPGDPAWHADAWCAQRALAVLGRHPATTPLFLWCSFPGPHYPHDPPRAFLDRVDHDQLPDLRFTPGEFDGEDKIQGPAFHGTRRFGLVEGAHHEGGTKSLTEADWRTIQSHYYAGVAHLDDLIGDLLVAARRQLGEEVLIVLTADHGDCMGAHRLWGKNRCAYEEVLRVPLLVQGPGFARGVTSAARVNLIDLFPTFLAQAGMDGDAVAALGLDGRPLGQSLHDGGHAWQLAANEGLLVVHDARWKLIVDQEHELVELYDRQTDPGETRNLAHEPACEQQRTRLQALALPSLMASALR